jgi:hypothetical protein
MSVTKIIQLANTEPEVFEQTGKRRDILKSFGSKLLLASLPIALSELFSNKAKAQNIQAIIETLQFGMTIELMQAEFYKEAVAKPNLIPSDAIAIFKKIAADTAGHVGAMEYYINDLGGTPVSPINFDYTGGMGQGGPFIDVFSNYQTFLQVAQIFADLATRAYKNIITNVMPQDAVLTHMMNIQSVKGRHAAHIRYARAGATPWITGNSSDISNPAAVKFYAGEQNVLQSGINMVNLNGFELPVTTVTQAFDEPMGRSDVMALVNNFIAP